MKENQGFVLFGTLQDAGHLPRDINIAAIVSPPGGLCYVGDSNSGISVRCVAKDATLSIQNVSRGFRGVCRSLLDGGICGVDGKKESCKNTFPMIHPRENEFALRVSPI